MRWRGCVATLVTLRVKKKISERFLQSFISHKFHPPLVTAHLLHTQNFLKMIDRTIYSFNIICISIYKVFFFFALKKNEIYDKFLLIRQRDIKVQLTMTLYHISFSNFFRLFYRKFSPVVVYNHFRSIYQRKMELGTIHKTQKKTSLVNYF